MSFTYRRLCLLAFLLLPPEKWVRMLLFVAAVGHWEGNAVARVLAVFGVLSTEAAHDRNVC
jgi:hypothetical protein